MRPAAEPGHPPSDRPGAPRLRGPRPGAGRLTAWGRTARPARWAVLAVLALLGGLLPWGVGLQAATPGPTPAPVCDKPVYLTFDTGHMGVADLVAQVLKQEGVKATFFLANERTLNGGHSLDDQWAPWWRARAAEGHAFGSHTWDHGRWLADRADGGFDLRPTMGPRAGQKLQLSAADYCAELARPAARFTEMTGQRMLGLFRAPSGKTSPALLAAAKSCGWQHVGWSSAGFLGDELPSEAYPNPRLLAQALRDIRPGDILLAHLGIWSRRDPWAPAVLAPLLQGLKARGFCFATLAQHPEHGRVAAAPAAR